jgi:hypothetical protein
MIIKEIKRSDINIIFDDNYLALALLSIVIKTPSKLVRTA